MLGILAALMILPADAAETCVPAPADEIADPRGLDWFANGETVTVEGRRYDKYALNGSRDAGFLEFLAASEGGYFFVERGDSERDVLYLLTGLEECFFQPYKEAEPEFYWPAPFMVFFDSGQSEVSKQSGAILDNAASTYAKIDLVAPVWIVGHADDTGSEQANLQLSESRAAAVRDYLVARSIPGSRITIMAEGEGSLLVDTGDGISDAQNRRVEVTFGPLSEGW